MKKILARLLAIFLFALVFINTSGQVKTKTFAKSIPSELLPVKTFIAKTIMIQPPSEFYKLKQQDETNENTNFKTKLPKLSLPLSVDINLLKDAAYTENNGLSVYSLTVKAADVLNLSIEFSEFILSTNSLLSIYSQNELTDSITAKENNKNKTWNTRTYDGNSLNIVLKLPNIEKEMVSIKINLFRI